MRPPRGQPEDHAGEDGVEGLALDGMNLKRSSRTEAPRR